MDWFGGVNGGYHFGLIGIDLPFRTKKSSVYSPDPNTKNPGNPGFKKIITLPWEDRDDRLFADQDLAHCEHPEGVP